MVNLKKFIERVPAGIFAILTAIIGAITIISATIAYHLSPRGPISFTAHWISHLGAGETSGIIFTIGLFITGFLALPFLTYMFLWLKPSLWDKHRIMLITAFIASIISIIGLWINAAWNMEYEGGTLHVTGSTTFFFAGLFMIIFYSLSMLFSDEVSWQQAIIGFIIAAIFATFLLSFLPAIAQGYDMMGLLTSTDPVAGTTRFIEWIVFFAVIFWFAEMGVYTLLKKK